MPMYYVLMDARTKCWYMKPREHAFYAFSDPEKIILPPNGNVRCVETEYETQKELTTGMFNSGFRVGYLDDKRIVLNSQDAYFLNQNPNEIAYAQYLLTSDTSVLEDIIVKEKLVSICKIDGNLVYFPTIELGDGSLAVLTYTDLHRIPQNLFKKYKDFRIVKMTFDTKCIVNDKFIAE